MKIIQILIGPNTIEWQGKLMGLGDDGCVYIAEDEGWKMVQDTKVQGEEEMPF